MANGTVCGLPNGINGHSGLTYSVSVNATQQSQQQAAKEHRKLDRSLSEPAEKMALNARTGNQTNSSRYKTELCRPFEENGTCKYGDKCQFAHGFHELRNLQRHPKYKTELCRTFHTSGFCPYGPRCHFIHNSEESKKSVITTLQAGCPTSGKTRDRSETIAIMSAQPGAKCESAPTPITLPPMRPKALSIGSYSLGSSGDLSQPSSPSGSPTSLSSFFTEDQLGSFTPHSAASNGNTTFSFSPDFTSLVSEVSSMNNANCRSLGMLASNYIQSPFAYQKSPDLVKERSASIFSNFPTNAAVIEAPQGKPSSPPLAFPYPAAPSSPVDSLGSELDMLSLGGGSSPIPTCSSPLNISKNIPRLPIFTRFANNGNTDSD
ncbi:zinc finger protein 36: C3H1 type-like 1 [Dinothrombium tinctorium]|uniref:Zinc finger protein 36: C3H1 type-like 1 n=1 Tax=Dinothrombium tinctorium TaxID=1965070 RepID=A0A443RMQ6_9ACAR|nr:zinc finger protein 36: C3H1 type-like 1 [Dinothrombium tinctorium]